MERLARAGEDATARFVAGLTDQEAEQLRYEWAAWARPEQLPPEGDWFVWLCQCGRGWGKTRTAVEYVRARIDAGVWRTVNIAGPTWTDVMDTMVRGTEESPGLALAWPPDQRPELRMSKDDPHLRTWNGAKIRLRAAHSAERFRGPQADGGWIDEVDAWRPDLISAEEALSIWLLGIRTGSDPRVIATSTPKPYGLVGQLRARPDCVTTRGSTLDNRVNLSPRFFEAVVAPLLGTRRGQQEIYGEELEDVDGAIVTHALIESARVVTPPALLRTVVGVDPAVTAGEDADETGIVVVGKGIDGDAYVLEDLSCRLSPDGWARRAVEAYHRHGADRIVVERNNGGEMCEATLRQVDRQASVKTVVASRGKHVRFEPIGALYEQERVHHVGAWRALEEQICAFTAAGYEGGASPDRADAAVWALSELMLTRGIGWGDIPYAA